MKNTEQLARQQEAEMKDLQLQHKVANALPTAPSYVLTSKHPSGIHIPSYTVDGLEVAVAFFAQFDEIVPCSRVYDGCVSVTPCERISPDKKHKAKGEHLFRLETNVSTERGTFVKLKAYVRHRGELYDVWVTVNGPQYIGAYAALAPLPNYNGKKIVGYNANAAASLYATCIVMWSVPERHNSSISYFYDDVGHLMGVCEEIAEETYCDS